VFYEHFGDEEYNAQSESLGTQVIEGVKAERARITSTIEAGAIGNDQPIQIVTKRWYSPELQMVVMSKRSHPRVEDRPPPRGDAVGRPASLATPPREGSSSGLPRLH
jgi:hypothetical protein